MRITRTGRWFIVSIVAIALTIWFVKLAYVWRGYHAIGGEYAPLIFIPMLWGLIEERITVRKRCRGVVHYETMRTKRAG